MLSTTVTLASTQTQPTLPARFDRQTYRLIVFATLGGTQVRVQVSNRFGRAPLVIGAAHLGLRQSQGSLQPNTDRALTFSGLTTVTLQPDEERWSDPVALAVPHRCDLAISLYLPQTFTPTAFHPTGLKTSYLSAPGNFCAEGTMPPALPDTTPMVFFVSQVQVNAGPVRTIVALGDSITDGACSDGDADGSWPDLLAKRLAAHPAGLISVVNAGIGSNRFTSSDGAGLRGLVRLPELLSIPNVAGVIVLEGINDISYEHISAAALIAAYRRAITLAHEAGVFLIGIPLLPIKNSVKDVGNNEITRGEVNGWIRHGGAFDAVIDLEPVMADPNDPKSLRPDLTYDFVHPNQAGYQAMADAIDLGLFTALALKARVE